MKVVQIRTLSIYLIALLSLGWLGGCANEGAQDWLSGRWVPVHNPLNEANDTLVFMADGKVVIETTDDRAIDGKFRIKDGFVIMNLAVPKRSTEVRLMISKDHKRLMFKNGAYFERRG